MKLGNDVNDGHSTGSVLLLLILFAALMILMFGNVSGQNCRTAKVAGGTYIEVCDTGKQ